MKKIIIVLAVSISAFSLNGAYFPTTRLVYIPNKFALNSITNWVSSVWDYWRGVPTMVYETNLDAKAKESVGDIRLDQLSAMSRNSLCNVSRYGLNSYLSQALQLDRTRQVELSSVALGLFPEDVGSTEKDYVRSLGIAMQVGIAVGALGDEDQKAAGRAYLENLVNDPRLFFVTQKIMDGKDKLAPEYSKFIAGINRAYSRLGGKNLLPEELGVADPVVKLLLQNSILQ